MGGIAGAIDPNFTQASMNIDYVRVYQNTIVDSEAPSNFTASVGLVTGTTVELLLKATDNSGNIVYNVAYGTQTATTAGQSGVQKSLTINGLNPNTNYSFTITASDLSDNAAANNPIVLNATTPAIIQCGGVSAEASQGSFSTGYNYNFQTIGTDVKITFELLDTNRVGVVAYLWKQSPFSEVQMTNVSGNIFTKTITGQIPGATISYAVKFAYAGGLSVTRYFTYVVGNNCSLGIPTLSEVKQQYYPNPVENILNLQLSAEQNQVILTDVLGQKQFEATVKSTATIDMTSLKSGIYFLRVKNNQGSEIKKIIKR